MPLNVSGGALSLMPAGSNAGTEGTVLARMWDAGGTEAGADCAFVAGATDGRLCSKEGVAGATVCTGGMPEDAGATAVGGVGLDVAGATLGDVSPLAGVAAGVAGPDRESGVAAGVDCGCCARIVPERALRKTRAARGETGRKFRTGTRNCMQTV